MQISSRNLKSGFTLIEILIVIAIIGLLLAVFLPNFNELRRKSRDQARKASIKSIAEALELYKLNQTPPSYPATLNITPGTAWVVNNVAYMNTFPKDPLYNAAPTKYFYRYARDTNDTLKYYLGACLEDKSDPDGRVTPVSSLFDDRDCPSERWYYRIEP